MIKASFLLVLRSKRQQLSAGWCQEGCYGFARALCQPSSLPLLQNKHCEGDDCIHILLYIAVMYPKRGEKRSRARYALGWYSVALLIPRYCLRMVRECTAGCEGQTA